MATLKFKNYFIESFSFRENNNFDIESENLDVDFNPKAVVNIIEDADMAAVLLSCTLGDESKIDCPFTGEVSLTGIFEIEYDKSDNEDVKLANDFLSQNSITILFPYLRSFIADMTLRTNKFPAFILQPFNVVEMVKDKDSVTVRRLKK
ncbi:protein-export chaperone SecB [Lactococcus lactis]|uniref:Preprotein translocase subunit SecB n=1 Tax=Lactococcus lactis TaxID=1358 RepID=A0A552Z215_9LACT|nr:protein-export chaperone SecB [Lactococcus lactis]MCT0080155.1 hypothetical protein [Lactococcus lactis subsp. lactis]MCT0442331.1 hypothetical protein [Lactococcus lactis subsp. lactis]TRW73497.1 hypothetical protein FNJ53_07155 [Lactococcus lactis]